MFASQYTDSGTGFYSIMNSCKKTDRTLPSAVKELSLKLCERPSSLACVITLHEPHWNTLTSACGYPMD